MKTLATTNPHGPLTVEQPSEPSTAQLMQLLIEKGNPAENAEALKTLVAIRREENAQRAKMEFTASMVQLKERLKENPVRATKIVPNNDGTTRYVFAPLEDIDKQLCPIALQFGFTYTFSEAPSDPGKVTKICEVEHIGGHSKSNPFTVRVAAVPKATDTQNDGAAHSYAKRGALCDAFGIIAEKDTDGADNVRGEGAPISQAQADSLRARVAATKANEPNFLAHAGAETYEKISSARYADLDELLTERARKQQH